jgi:DNA-binding beta-propeller fold protein YncE
VRGQALLSSTGNLALALIGVAMLAMLALSATPASADYFYRASFSGPAELEAPRRVAVEQSTGNLFVVDSGHDRVLVFKPEGNSGSLLTELGVGTLSDPYGIAIRESGGQTEVYVSDAGNDRIVRFLSDEQPTPSFSLDATFASPAKGTEADEIASFASPLALAPNGDLWVADRGANVVKRFDPTGAHVAGSNFDGSTSPTGVFTGLLDLAANASGDLYALDTTGDVSQQLGESRVERFTASGAHLASLSPLGPENRAAMVAVNPVTGTVAVSGRQDAVYHNVSPTVHFFDAANAPLYERSVDPAFYASVQGLAFSDEDIDLLYAVSDFNHWNGAQFGEPRIHTFEDLPVPLVTLEPVDPTTVTATEAAVEGTLDPEGESVEWWFEYKSTTASEWSKTSVGFASGTDPIQVQVELTGLRLGTEYQVRLVATGSLGVTTSSPRSFTTQIEAPVFGGAWARPEDRSATLRARIDPRGGLTTYRFEYGLTTAYGQSTADRTVPAGSNDQNSVGALVEGLEPDTTYHFRVVAQNPEGGFTSPDHTFTTTAVADPCPNSEFRTGLSAELTDCRAYELVTPPGAHANLRVAGGPATPDGGTVCFDTDYPLLDADPNGIKNIDDGFCSWRRAGGWETKWVTGPAPVERNGTAGANVYYLSDDGNRVVFASDVAMLGRDYRYPGTSGPTAPPNSAYLWEAGQTTWLAPPPPPVGDPPAILQEGVYRGGATPGWVAGRRPLAVSDDARHVIFESDLPIIPADENTLVDVYEWSPGGLRLVSSDAAGKAAGGHVLRQAYEQTRGLTGTISADGGRVFFSHKGAPLDGPAPEAVESVYMREGDEVTLVSPRRGSGPDADVFFAGASADGERVLLETTQQLTPEPKQSGAALYSYDVSDDELTLEADAEGGVQILGSSADASTFVYRTQSDNQLIVRRAGTDIVLGKHAALDLLNYRVAAPREDVRALRFTPDGSALTFVSAGEFGSSGPGVAQVYRWAAGEGLENISAPADGVASANASIGAYSTFIPGDPREEVLHFHKNKMLSGRVISDDGTRVFFETPEALVERDVNGVTDVYEWHDGEVNLVSSGTGSRSLYHESSADGKTVFFQTFERLIPELDVNTKRDLYVAQPGGGLPLPEVKTPCQGEACQAALQAPVPTKPGSTGGDGNLPAAPKVAFGKKQLKRLADKGKATVKVTVGAPGKVTALLKGKLNGRKAVVVARASRNATKPGVIRLELKLSRKARRKLAEDRKLALTLEIRQAGQTVRRGVMLHG